MQNKPPSQLSIVKDEGATASGLKGPRSLTKQKSRKLAVLLISAQVEDRAPQNHTVKIKSLVKSGHFENFLKAWVIY
jgi:hypothetical protein